MNRNLVNSKLDKYRERGKGTYTFCQVGCDCNIAVNLLEKCENLQSKIDKAIEYIEENILDNKIEKVNWDYDECYYSDMPVDRIKPLIDILKEVENVENN